MDPAVLQNGETRHDRVSAMVTRMRSNVFDAFFPDPKEVSHQTHGSLRTSFRTALHSQRISEAVDGRFLQDLANSHAPAVGKRHNVRTLCHAPNRAEIQA